MDSCTWTLFGGGGRKQPALGRLHECIKEVDSTGLPLDCTYFLAVDWGMDTARFF